MLCWGVVTGGGGKKCATSVKKKEIRNQRKSTIKWRTDSHLVNFVNDDESIVNESRLIILEYIFHALEGLNHDSRVNCSSNAAILMIEENKEFSIKPVTIWERSTRLRRWIRQHGHRGLYPDKPHRTWEARWDRLPVEQKRGYLSRNKTGQSCGMAGSFPT